MRIDCAAKLDQTKQVNTQERLSSQHAPFFIYRLLHLQQVSMHKAQYLQSPPIILLTKYFGQVYFH